MEAYLILPEHKMPPFSLTVMIPALNEEQVLESTFNNVIQAAQKINGLTLDVVIVNDGSSDNTRKVADSIQQKHESTRVIHHSTNRGIGASLQEVVKDAEGEKIVIIPGDNDLPFDLIYSLFSNAHKADLVSCFFLNREKRGRKRNILSTWFGLFYMIAFNVFLQYINGPCVYPTKMLRELKLISTRFSIVAEINVKLLRKGVTFHEIAGYMQTGIEGSHSLSSFKSFIEVAITYARLLYDVRWASRAEYNKLPVRYQEVGTQMAADGTSK